MSHEKLRQEQPTTSQEWREKFEINFGDCQDFDPSAFTDFIESLLTQVIEDIETNKESWQMFPPTGAKWIDVDKLTQYLTTKYLRRPQ